MTRKTCVLCFALSCREKSRKTPGTRICNLYNCNVLISDVHKKNNIIVNSPRQLFLTQKYIFHLIVNFKPDLWARSCISLQCVPENIHTPHPSGNSSFDPPLDGYGNFLELHNLEFYFFN